METDPVSEISCSFKHRTMDKVQKPRNSLCYSPSSQPFRNYSSSYVSSDSINEACPLWHIVWAAQSCWTVHVACSFSSRVYISLMATFNSASRLSFLVLDSSCLTCIPHLNLLILFSSNPAEESIPLTFLVLQHRAHYIVLIFYLNIQTPSQTKSETVTRYESGLIIAFRTHNCKWYNALTNSHTVQFTTVHAKSSQSAVPSCACCLVAARISGDSSASLFTSLPAALSFSY
jgi:hypothetical protein